MTGGFVLRGPAPAAKAFLVELVGAIVDGDPHVSGKMIDGACAAVCDHPGFPNAERRSTLEAEVERMRAAGLLRVRRGDLGDLGINDLASALRLAMRDAAEANLRRHKRGIGPWDKSAF